MLEIGLTGGIGSGKSTVAALLVEWGAELLDADAIVRELQEPGTSVFVAMVERWGDDIVIGDVTQAAYLGPWLWKAAVEKAGSFDIDKVREASPGIELTTAPEGYVRVHKNHHLWSKTRIWICIHI